MLGAILGDVIGSVHEYIGTKTKRFPLFVEGSDFTDDSVLTVAVAEWLLDGGDLADLLARYVRTFPGRGYGSMFSRWAQSSDRRPYNSFGNGSAMRVSAVGFAFETLDEVLQWAKRSAEVTHDHQEGIRGAQATAVAIFLARHGRDKDAIRHAVESDFGYDLGRPLDDIRPEVRVHRALPPDGSAGARRVPTVVCPQRSPSWPARSSIRGFSRWSTDFARASPSRERYPIRSMRAATCLCHGVPARKSRSAAAVSSFGATPTRLAPPSRGK